MRLKIKARIQHNKNVSINLTELGYTTRVLIIPCTDISVHEYIHEYIHAQQPVY